MTNTLSILLCSQFWSDFFPNFASTVLGLILGLPIALWTNRQMSNAQDNQKQKELEVKLKDALRIIRATLAENQNRIQTTISTVNNNLVQFDIELDISAWDAVKEDIVNNLHDSGLKKKIAYHFSRLNSVTKLNSLYLDRTTGIASALGGAGATNAVLKNYLLETANFLNNDISEILPLIDRNLTT